MYECMIMKKIIINNLRKTEDDWTEQKISPDEKENEISTEIEIEQA